MNEGAGHLVFGGRSGPLGPFIPNRKHMGLDCIPRQCPDHSHANLKSIPDGSTHPESEPCPFAGDRFPTIGPCCWLRGKIAARELEALGEGRIADRMHEDMPCEEAIAFGELLFATAHAIESEHADSPVKPRGAGWDGHLDKAQGKVIWGKYSTFEEALAWIREAARWYEKVGHLGFGVHAWY